MTHRNADTPPKPGETLIIDGTNFTVVETPTDFPLKHKSADQRIREAFDALRAEMVSLFGEPKEPADCDDPNWPLWHCVATIDAAQEIAHDLAKLPADA